MKMLTTVFMLMLIPFAAHAERGHYIGHRNHQHNQSHFWQDVEHRQYRQDARIERGIERGQLTRREARKLKREQKHVAKQVRHMQRHNYLSRADKREVMEHLNYASDKIRTLKHNRRNAHRRNYSNHDHGRYTHANDYNRNYGRRDRAVWANNGGSAGIYFRF